MAVDPTDKAPSLPPGFQQAANPAGRVTEPPKVMVSLPLDADLVACFQSETEPSDWQHHINGVLRFYVETTQMAEADAAFDAELAQHLAGPKP